MSTRVNLAYEELLQRLRKKLGKEEVRGERPRLELPPPNVVWVGTKTILRNFSEYPKLLRRDPNKILMFLAKVLATAASLDGERAVFIGRKHRETFSALLNRYMKDAVICPVCGSPDTKGKKERRLNFLVCEACGAVSPAKIG